MFDIIYTFETMKRFRIATLLLLVTLLFSPAHLVQAETSEFSVTPVIVNEKAKVRDIIKQSITLTNTTGRKLNLYPSVYDVSITEGETEFKRAEGSAERSVSLANWIELSRGVIELGPGEEKVIPFVIRVNLDATPGMYHAHISLSEGSTREEAEAGEPLSTVTVNVEVEKDVKEVLQLGSFSTDNFFLSGDDVIFNYQVENIGNQELQPKGEIRIYDRSGKEIASVPVNKDGSVFSPEQKAQLASVWSGAEGFGKYKAFLNIDYGSSQLASVQDTVFFWIVPWKQLTLFFVIGILLVGAGVFFIHRRHEMRLGFHPMPLAGFPHAAPHYVPSPTPKKPGKPLWPFQFGGKSLPSVVSQPAPEVHTNPIHHEPSPEVHSTPAVAPAPRPHPTILSVSIPRAPVHGSTINLKDLPMRKKDSHVVTDGHVINLKK
jgi:hypothetical protein